MRNKMLLVFLLLWLVLMLKYDQTYYPTTDAEMMEYDLKWGLP